MPQLIFKQEIKVDPLSTTYAVRSIPVLVLGIMDSPSKITNSVKSVTAGKTRCINIRFVFSSS